MINNEFLQTFCVKKSDSNDWARSPFRLYGTHIVNQWVYATNRNIMIRVPNQACINSYAITGTFPDYVKTRITELFDWCPSGENPPISEPDINLTHCTKCHGGYHLCTVCNGEGVFEYHGYEYDCQSCEGRGTVSNKQDMCNLCNDTGFELQIVGMGGHWFDGRLIAKCNDLVNKKWYIDNMSKRAYCMFDTGTVIIASIQA
jgi:hypothetical protein